MGHARSQRSREARAGARCSSKIFSRSICRRRISTVSSRTPHCFTSRAANSPGFSLISPERSGRAVFFSAPILADRTKKVGSGGAMDASTISRPGGAMSPQPVLRRSITITARRVGHAISNHGLAPSGVGIDPTRGAAAPSSRSWTAYPLPAKKRKSGPPSQADCSSHAGSNSDNRRFSGLRKSLAVYRLPQLFNSLPRR